jgi:hypothetical protein
MPAPGEASTVAPAIIHVRLFVEQLSDMVALGTATVAVQTPASALPVMFAGQVITGAWLSVTVTVKLHVAVFPAPSPTV